MKKIIKIEGMHCAHCAARVEKALSALGGKVAVNHADGIAAFESASPIDSDLLKNTIEDLGFDVVSIS